MSSFSVLSLVLVTVVYFQPTIALLADLNLHGLGLGGLHELLLQGGCRCQVVDNRNRGMVLQNFGRIQACGLGLCGCGAGVRSCRQACQRVVDDWAANICPVALRGVEVRAVFQADQCANGIGDATADCDGRGRGGLVVPGGLGGIGGLGGGLGVFVRLPTLGLGGINGINNI